MNLPDQPTQPTEAHRKLWTALYNLAHREIFEDYAESSDGPATQLIADSEARAVEEATKQLRSELASERARLDYLALQMGTPRVADALDLDYSLCFPIRDAIDLAMKNESNTP